LNPTFENQGSLPAGNFAPTVLFNLEGDKIRGVIDDFPANSLQIRDQNMGRRRDLDGTDKACTEKHTA
jgi:hypothetical protein